MSAAHAGKARRLVVLATGGTGGHTFPAAALAEALAARGCELMLFTDRRDIPLPPALAELPVERLPAQGVAGRGLVGRMRAMTELARGTWQAVRLLRRYRPAVVVGFGGYASVPTMLAAQRVGIPTVLHEQNAVLGRANRVAAGRARAICTSFEIVAGLAADTSGRTIRTGNPVRAAIAALRDQPYPTPIPGGPLSLLVTGGSQGARVFGQVLPHAMEYLAPEHRVRLRLVQQCRPEQIEQVRAAYAAVGVNAEVMPFVEDMAGRLAEAHLVVCRAGATTVAELTAAGRPAILVPYPYAADDHQTANAQAMSAGGGAWLMPQDSFSAPALSARLTQLLEHPETLAEAASCARALGIADAAERLTGTVINLLPHSNGNSDETPAERREAAQ
ncbi:MAG: undecaprenyldiphospho-muramoylpentapeptide beta-N-acetylglucosaminyltransferase [Alphaproteobacteria bacterium]|nr:undecaprenyldiphospho-muramoylpentapeptide beta-N-acetylglucosaminyltransferase [Alphaproteobacteria bacterium]